MVKRGNLERGEREGKGEGGEKGRQRGGVECGVSGEKRESGEMD